MLFLILWWLDVATHKAWIEGVKDLTEPMIILNLSWALGTVIQVSSP